MFSSPLKRRILLMIMDSCVIILSFYLALVLRFEQIVPEIYWQNLEMILPTTIIVFLFTFTLMGLYRTTWRYASIDEIIKITAAVTLGLAGIYLYSWSRGTAFPRSIYVILWLFLLFLVGGSRLGVRLVRDFKHKFGRFNHQQVALKQEKGCNAENSPTRILIFGAGDAGVLVARELKKHANNHRLVGFIDDDHSKQEQIVQGLPVLGTRNELQQIVKEKNVNEVVIAIPSASYSVIKKVVNLCLEAGVKVKTVPGIYEILEGRAHFTMLKEVQIEDLLKRPAVKMHIDRIAGYLTGETVLVTGCGGSIGSELCRQILGLNPACLVLFERDENNLFHIHRELQMLNGKHNGKVELLPVVGDVQDYHLLDEVFSSLRPGVVFHAAAYKHVPLMEISVNEAIKNNIYGTKNVADAAHYHGAERFVLVSTDKAVNPSSVMGATKRVAELYLQLLSKNSNTLFSAVRFGNVLGSRGSVVPIFKEQIERGGPVTVTHPEMVRYFMTIPEAVQLIIQSGALTGKGAIFVLDMGDPVKIYDLAVDMIMLSGLKLNKDIEIEFTGVRPGEKLYEELFTEKETFSKTENERIFIAKESILHEEDLWEEMGRLRNILGTDFFFLLDTLKKRKSYYVSISEN